MSRDESSEQRKPIRLAHVVDLRERRLAPPERFGLEQGSGTVWLERQAEPGQPVECTRCGLQLEHYWVSWPDGQIVGAEHVELLEEA